MNKYLKMIVVVAVIVVGFNTKCEAQNCDTVKSMSKATCEELMSVWTNTLIEKLNKSIYFDVLDQIKNVIDSNKMTFKNSSYLLCEVNKKNYKTDVVTTEEYYFTESKDIKFYFNNPAADISKFVWSLNKCTYRTKKQIDIFIFNLDNAKN